ncbi:MAG: DNA translocase FtsK 4TM domain-containing protein, partial [Vallitaleaceae bacterium]|nr:DNA translocase FtsK 4TM domain-containing protein [Vallitaleaceae bacterium]
MAQGKQSTQNRRPKTSSTRRQPSKATLTKQKKAQAAKLKYEIVVISILVLSIFVMMCVYFGLGGLFGAWLRKMMFGLFGISAYILPLFLFVGTTFKIFNQNNQRLNNKLIQSFFLIVIISAISHVRVISASQIDKSLFDKSTFYPSLINYFSISAKEQFAGGFIGGLIGDIFAFVLGRNGAMIIYVLIGLSLLILITEQSFFEIIKWIGRQLKTFGAYIGSAFNEIIEARRAHVAEL